MNIKITKVTPIDNYKLIVEFDNGITKQYDMSKLFDLEAFKPLENKFLFNQAYADPFGHGVIWNDEIDISEYELWKNGQPYIEIKDKQDE
jgi:hypothetical protein